VVATKGGFLPFDGERPDDPAAYVRERFIEPEIVAPDDLANRAHAIAPDYLEWSLDRSLNRLGLDTVDCYYVHNPETQLVTRSREAVYDQLETAFEALERRRTAGDIRAYGVATWHAFRVAEDDERYLSLAEVLARAEAAGEAVGPDDDHGFGAIQLPFNVAMADAFTRRNQRSPGDDSEPVSTLELAHEAGLSVVTSASIGQGDLAVVGGDPGRHRRNPRGRDPGAARAQLRTERAGGHLARSSARATSITFARTSPPGRSTLSARRRSTRCSSSARGEVRERTETRERNAGTR